MAVELQYLRETTEDGEYVAGIPTAKGQQCSGKNYGDGPRYTEHWRMKLIITTKSGKHGGPSGKPREATGKPNPWASVALSLTV